MNAQQIKEYFESKVKKTVSQHNINPGIKGAINGIISRACGGSDNRKLVLKYLCGVTSSKELNAAQWIVLSEMVKPEKPALMNWQSGNPKFQSVINAILAELPRQEGQGEFFDADNEANKYAFENQSTAV